MDRPKRKADVLVVDHEPDWRARCVDLLRSVGGVTARSVPDGHEAIRAMEDRNADLVLLDVRAPSPSGEEVFASLARRWPEVPVVVLTAEDHEPPALHRVRQRACDCLVKPFAAETLRKVVERALEGGESAASAAFAGEETFPRLLSRLHALPTLNEASRALVVEALARADGNQSAAARMLGLSPSALCRRLQQMRKNEGGA